MRPPPLLKRFNYNFQVLDYGDPAGWLSFSKHIVSTLVLSFGFLPNIRNPIIYLSFSHICVESEHVSLVQLDGS